ncbi:MAG: hypothetical protein HEQ21_01655 [Blastomonas sp.]|uniref:hypothetical protein n=1 Tax=Blastomonas sp. TaxID=1909299 RepID=UPI0025843C5E|nr:hypothetical protein [Blastomonas sp.]MCO5791502.1 hypothetical protein [Blastomonas sp.]
MQIEKAMAPAIEHHHASMVQQRGCGQGVRAQVILGVEQQHRLIDVRQPHPRSKAERGIMPPMLDIAAHQPIGKGIVDRVERQPAGREVVVKALPAVQDVAAIGL